MSQHVHCHSLCSRALPMGFLEVTGLFSPQKGIFGLTIYEYLQVLEDAELL